MAAVTVEYLQAACDRRLSKVAIETMAPLPSVLTSIFDSAEAALEAPIPERCNYAIFNNGSERYIFVPATGWQKIPNSRLRQQYTGEVSEDNHDPRTVPD